MRFRLLAGAGIYVSGALIIEAWTGAVEERSGRNVGHVGAAVEKFCWFASPRNA